jgi:hypothetical protein
MLAHPPWPLSSPAWLHQCLPPLSVSSRIGLTASAFGKKTQRFVAVWAMGVGLRDTAEQVQKALLDTAQKNNLHLPGFAVHEVGAFEAFNLSFAIIFQSPAPWLGSVVVVNGTERQVWAEKSFKCFFCSAKEHTPEACQGDTTLDPTILSCPVDTVMSEDLDL